MGVIVVSKLGLDQFDQDELRLLEVLAGHASVALVNARLYEQQRREAESAKALLELSTELSACTDLESVASRIAVGSAGIMRSSRAAIWLPASMGTPGGSASWQADTSAPWDVVELLPEIVDRTLPVSTVPFVLARDRAAAAARHPRARSRAATSPWSPFPSGAPPGPSRSRSTARARSTSGVASF